MNKPFPICIVITGPDGVGKKTIVQRMRERRLQFHYMPSVLIRESNITALHYQKNIQIVTRNSFNSMVRGNEFFAFSSSLLNTAGITKNAMNSALESGQDIVAIMNFELAKSFRKLYSRAITIFIYTDQTTLIRRLNQNTNGAMNVNNRIKNALHVMEQAYEFDYLVENLEYGVESGVDSVVAIFYAEKLKSIQYNRTHQKVKALLQKPMVFLCYAHEDRMRALELYEALKAAGLKPWLDEISIPPGKDWELEIKLAIQQADFFLALVSQNSVAKRGYVQKEIRIALDELDKVPEDHAFLIPVRLENCEVPSRLSRRQFVDIFWPDGLQKLINVLLSKQQ